MEPSSSVPALDGLTLEAVEWLPSGADAGLLRVRGRWSDLSRHEPELPALGVRRGAEARRFESLPDARFSRDPAIWRATFLVPAALIEPRPDELWLSWESGARAGLPAPAAAAGFEAPPTAAEPARPEPGGEVISRAVMAERRARRAEAAERTQAERAAQALKALEVLELRSAELERRLEAVQPAPPPEAHAAPEARAAPEAGAEAGAGVALPADRAAPAAGEPAVGDTREAALAAAVATVKRLRGEFYDQRQRLRRSELMRAADTVALASLREHEGRARELQAELAAAEHALAEARAAAEERAAEVVAAREQAAEQVAAAQRRAAADAAAVRTQAADERDAAERALAVERERAAVAGAASAEARSELEVTGHDLAAERAAHAATRERLATRDEELAAIGEELAGVRGELAIVRRDATERADALERRLAELEAALGAERREHSLAATELETARARLAAAEAARRAESVARAALEEEVDRERLAQATLAEALDAARADLTRSQTTQADLVLTREEARAAAAVARTRAASAEDELAHLRGESASAEAELARVRDQADATRTELARVREDALAVESAVRAEAAAVEDGLRAELGAALAGATEARDAARRSDAELHMTRDELVAARAWIAELEHELESRPSGLTSAEREAGGLLARIVELEQAGDADLAPRAREQADAAAAAPRARDDDRRALWADLDAAAAGLRARVEPPAATEPDVADAADRAVESTRAGEETEPAAAEPAVVAPPVSESAVVDRAVPGSAVAEPEVDPAVSGPAVAEPALEAAGGEAAARRDADTAASVDAAAASPPGRPRIITEKRHPPRADVVGRSARDYPWLRGALVKLAHDDPRAASRLMLGLVPAQHALVGAPLDYDLTIKGAGTYAVTVTDALATAAAIEAPRPRSIAAFHVAADVVALAELLAGVNKRMGRWWGAIRVHGRRRDARTLRAALTAVDLSLGAAVRAGAELDPDLIFRTFAYAIHPSWTRGHHFTIAQELTDPQPERWYILVRDGAPLAIERRAPAQPPDAVVSMSRTALEHLLRGEPAPRGERPWIRGDRAAVAALKAWTDRAQGMEPAG